MLHHWVRLEGRDLSWVCGYKDVMPTTLPRIPGALTLFGVNTTLLNTIGAGEILDGLRPAFEEGQLTSPDIARTFPVDQAVDAYRQIAGGTAKGKMVIVFKS